jgi:plasmid stabilization system protein ParE
MAEYLTDEQIAEALSDAKVFAPFVSEPKMRRTLLALLALQEKLQAAEAQLKPIADWLGSPKDNHRLGEVIPSVLRGCRQRCEAAEAEIAQLRTDLKEAESRIDLRWQDWAKAHAKGWHRTGFKDGARAAESRLQQLEEALREIVEVGTKAISAFAPATQQQLVKCYSDVDRIARAALAAGEEGK